MSSPGYRALGHGESERGSDLRPLPPFLFQEVSGAVGRPGTFSLLLCSEVTGTAVKVHGKGAQSSKRRGLIKPWEEYGINPENAINPKNAINPVLADCVENHQKWHLQHGRTSERGGRESLSLCLRVVFERQILKTGCWLMSAMYGADFAVIKGKMSNALIAI